MSDFDQAKYVADYKKKNIRQFKIDLNYQTEADLIEYLENLPNRTAFIKELLRKEMEK